MARKQTNRQPTATQPATESIHHSGARTNIPMREQSGLVPGETGLPSLLFPRDPSLDPQLVWKGKDEQDRDPLRLPCLPLFIQEKIHPQAIIENLRPSANATELRQAELFSDFGGTTDPVKRTEFYRHDERWSNRFILGDSLYVMASLAERERLRGRVQLIFFDPPYGIQFGSNWQVSTRAKEVKDSRVEHLSRQPEQIRAFRDTWELGIHSYLSYLRDRLTAARELLTESGSLFLQIGDENVHLARCLLDEVFGSDGFIANIAFKKKKMPLGESFIFTTCDYLLWYGKDRTRTKFRKLYLPRDSSGDGDYGYLELPDGSSVSRAAVNGTLPTGARAFQSMDLRSSGRTESCVFPVEWGGKRFTPSEGKSWKTNPQGMQRLSEARRLFCAGTSLRYKLFYEDYPVQELSHMWLDTQGAVDKTYVVQTSTKVVERCILMASDAGDLVLDPTCGSGTTAYVAEQWGRRWITTDTSRVALALARTRLMGARYPYYLLADTPEGQTEEAKLLGIAPPNSPTGGDITRGFVNRRAPHITLGSISNNPDIHAGMTSQQIDAAVRRHAESVTLFDKPLEDKDIVRVAGPFTVESLSPHRVLPAGDGPKKAAPSGEGFAASILAHLRKAGVQNTRKAERLTFDRLDPYPGELLQAQGTYAEGGADKRVAVCIGPEFGTVGPELLSGAAQEASRGVGFDLLLVCGFAFDPHAGGEGQVIERQLGRLRVLLVRMNPDLSMGDGVLKNTGAGNLFLVFGEPDVALETLPGGKMTLEVRGVDVFDPTSGEVRSAGPDEIACWFIDTNYDGESFFVRHAYFLGGQEPYDKLKRALRAEVDEAAWSALYSAKSRPFDRPPRGKVAVKVINHYGDEVLKVYTVPVGKGRK